MKANPEESRLSAAFTTDGLVIRLEAPAPVLAPDELVAFPFGLERSAARALVRRGTLAAAQIGRRVYARRSDVLALIDTLGSVKKRRGAADSEDTYETLVAMSRGRTR